MDAVLLDTNVFSYLMKTGDERADLYRSHVQGKRIAVSFVTVGELYAWAFKRAWGPKRVAQLEARLRAAVIIPYDVEVCRAYARLVHLKTETGSDRTIPANDRWIAACAMRHHLALVTHNRKDFDNIPNLVLITEAPPKPRLRPGALPLGGPALT